MKTVIEQKVYTPREVMDIFKISRPTFGDWCRKGVFRKIHIPGQRRVFVTADSVNKLIDGSKKY